LRSAELSGSRCLKYAFDFERFCIEKKCNCKGGKCSGIALISGGRTSR
jgi:hypothetical protein